MCGLVFAYLPEIDAPERRNRIRAALSALAHRGPDDEGIAEADVWIMGHRRLSILDLSSAGRQPMRSPDHRYFLAYNGEIYNFRDLRGRLQTHWQFRSESDTEVVLAGLILEGPAFVQRMEGMWAIAFWDTESQDLILSRDRMGKKPLYVQHSSSGLACASELPALAAVRLAPWSEDPDSSADYLRHGYHLPGTTAYRGVHEVLPGHTWRWSPGQPPRQHRYWQLDIGGYPATRQSALAELRQTLTDAVRQRLVADVEVGAFLSGGIDSSIIVAILAEHLDVRPKTFTVGFTESSFDERGHAARTAHRFGTDHYEYCLQDWNRDTLVDLVTHHVGQPFFDSSLLPTAQVAALAGEHVKVVLSGDGGDELFSGYQRYMARAILRWYTRLPRPLRRLAEHALRALPEPMAHHSHSLLKKAHLFLDIVDRQRSETPYVAPLLYSNDDFAVLAPDLAGHGHAPPELPAEAREDAILEMMSGDALVYLPQDILLKVDRASMAHSVEARCPFLDRRVVELAFSLPIGWQRDAEGGKRMLRDAFTDLLPREVWKRRKRGFAVPVHAWFRGPLATELKTLLEQAPAPLARPVVKRLLTEHQTGRRDHGYRLWNLYIYLLWRQHPWQPS